MANKLIECKTCNTQIAENAEACPQCGAKNKKPIYKKWWLWATVAVVSVVTIASSGGNDTATQTPSAQTSNTSTQTAADTPASTADAPKAESSATSAPANRAYGVGDTVNDGDLEITLVAIEIYNSDNQFLQPDSGNMYIKVDLTAVNNSASKVANISSMLSYNGYADDESVNQSYLTADGVKDFSGEVAAGKKLSGSIFFEIPENTEVFELQYTPNVWSDKRVSFIKEF